MTQRETFKLLNQDALRNAKSFHCAFEVLYSQKDASGIFPAAVNGLFAIELYFKSWNSQLEYEKSQDELINMQSNYPKESEEYKTLQNAIDIGITTGKFKKHTGNIKSHKLIDLFNTLPEEVKVKLNTSELDFDLNGFLEKYSNSFSSFRYYHENPHELTDPPLQKIQHLLIALKKLSLETLN